MTKIGKWASILLGIACLAVPHAVTADVLNYLYIDASEGNASGGHVALQFDDTVYHFQHVEPGLIRLFKENAADFEYRYRYLENRTLEVSRLGVNGETFQQLRDQFELRYQIQKRQFELLSSLDAQSRLLKALLHVATHPHSHPPRDEAFEGIALQGAGLFFDQGELDEVFVQGGAVTSISPAAASPPLFPLAPMTSPGSAASLPHEALPLRMLRQHIESVHGKGFLDTRLRSLDVALQTLRPQRLKKHDFVLPARERLPRQEYTFFQHYRDLVTQRLALQVLLEARPLKARAQITPNSPAFTLDARATAALCAYGQTLREDILALLDSKRPDPGYPLLVQMARLIVVDRSCHSGRLIFLNLFQAEAPAFVLEELPQPRDFWRRLEAEQALRWRQMLRDLAQPDGLSEIAYSLLEMNANRYWELHSALHSRQTLRPFGLSPLPDQTLALVSLPPTFLPPHILQQAIVETEQARRAYLNHLKRWYRYQLLGRNCVTEIFRTLEEGLRKQIAGEGNASADVKTIREASIRRLGGYIDPGLPNLIPFVSSRAVRDHYRILATRRLESYRQQKLRGMAATPALSFNYLREANTLTSTLYRPRGADSWFLFFSDDILLPRPLYGAVNTGVALLQTLAGLASLPFDGGETLTRGASGLLSSVVEMAFCNIRKGSFAYAPPGKPGLIDTPSPLP